MVGFETDRMLRWRGCEGGRVWKFGLKFGGNWDLLHVEEGKGRGLIICKMEGFLSRVCFVFALCLCWLFDKRD